MEKLLKPKMLTMLIFIAVLSLFLFVANLVVYKALADIFTITASRQLTTLGISLAVLSVSFIAASVLGMYFYNSFTKIYYLLSAIWMGFFVYLFLASCIYGLLVLFPNIYFINIIGKILIVGVLVVGVYGVIHAKNINVVNVQISLPSLPIEWQGKKAIWVSDLHLGQINGSSFSRKIVEKINAIPHDIVFIGGDLYDGTNAPDATELIMPFKEISAPLGVYFITGNHEGYGDSDKFISSVKSVGIRVLQDEVVNIDGLQIIGVDYRNTSKKDQIQKILSGLSIDKNKPSILLKHEPTDLDVVNKAGISLQISGHTHQAQLWPLGYLANSIYKGFAYGLKNLGDMQIYTSSGIGTWGPPMRVGTNSEIVVFTFENRIN
jgi:predicted MPP superfamily phosphohydrolase